MRENEGGKNLQTAEVGENQSANKIVNWLNASSNRLQTPFVQKVKKGVLIKLGALCIKCCNA